MCRVLEVSTSGYYAWLRRSLSLRAREDESLSKKIETIHAESDGTYGAPRIQAELRSQGVHTGRKRIARLMRRAGLRGVSRRKWITTTKRDARAQAAPDLVQRNFRAAGPNQLWVADIERHEAQLNRAVMKDHRHRLVAAGRVKLGVA
jgi:putative transposase